MANGGHHGLTDQKPASPGTSMAASLNRDVVIPPFRRFTRARFRALFGSRSVARPSRGHLLFLKVLLGDRPFWRFANGQNPNDFFNRSAEEF
jgi:hypothetical protein